MHKIILPTFPPNSEFYCGLWPHKPWVALSTSQSNVNFFRNWQLDLFVLDRWQHLIGQKSQYVQWGIRFIGYRDVVMRWEWHSEIQNYGIRFSQCSEQWHSMIHLRLNLKVSYLVLSDHLRLLISHPPCPAPTRNFRIENFWGLIRGVRWHWSLILLYCTWRGV
jgi:hypothetical protein